MTDKTEIVRTLEEMKLINDNTVIFHQTEFRLALSEATSSGLDWHDLQDLTLQLNNRLSGRGSQGLRYSLNSLIRKYKL